MTGYCVCVPARNEADRLPVLLEALARQTVAGPIPVSLCINNSDDDSAAVVASLAARYGDRLAIATDVCSLASPIAHVGTARGRAMTAGLRLLDGRGLLISTDADCRPPSGWIAANLAAVAAGADVVGGRIVLDDAEPIDPAIVAVQQRYDAYWASVRAIEDTIDPSPHDPPPRHGDHTGASLAIDAALFETIGGVPALATGEDRAMVVRAVAAGGRLVHPLSVWTRVSARTEGRAPAGMAHAMAERAMTIDRGAPLHVPALSHWTQRATWRRAQRAAIGTSAMLEAEERLAPVPADMALPVATVAS